MGIKQYTKVLISMGSKYVSVVNIEVFFIIIIMEVLIREVSLYMCMYVHVCCVYFLQCFINMVLCLCTLYVGLACQ